MIVTWPEIKAFSTEKSLPIHYLTLTDAFYIKVVSNIFELECNLSDDGNEHVVDFKANFKSSANKLQPPQLSPFAEPTHRTKLDATDDIISIPAAEIGEIVFKMPEERFVTGGSITVKNAKLGDFLVAFVADVDGIIPGPARASLCETAPGWPVVATYCIKQWIEVQGEYSVMKINTYPLNAKIPKDLYLVVQYHTSEEAGDRKVAVNYHLTKKL